MTIAVGMLSDRLGHGIHDAYWMEGRTACHGRSYSVIPSDAYLERQPRIIHVDWRHNRNRPIGEVRHLEQTAGGDLWCVAALVDGAVDLDDHEPLYWSPWVRGRCPDGMTFHDVVIDSVAITSSPASVGLRPIEFDPQPEQRSSLIAQMLERAAAAHRPWERQAAIIIRRPPDPHQQRGASGTRWPLLDAPTEMRHTGGGYILDVR